MIVEQYNLKPNHTVAMPQRLLFLDTETRGERRNNIEYHKMYMGWTYYCRRSKDTGMLKGKWEFHTDGKSLCEYIDSCVPKKTSLYIFAHNAFFDIQASGFFRYFTEMGWRLDFIYESGLTYILTMKREGSTVKVLSTTNWFATSLKKLGEMIDLPKLDIDFNESDYESVKAYCKRDVEILVEAVGKYLEMLQDNDLGKFSLTRASQAFAAFRHRFMDIPIAIHKEEKVQALERLAYMGGRTECFFIGRHPGNEFASLDINSMYPFIMRNFELPRELVDYREDISIDEAEVMVEKYAVIAECHISTDEPAYAKRMQDRIVFPIGNMTAYLTTPGMKYAIEQGHLVAVKRIALYKKDILFRSYVDYFYTLRNRYKSEGNDIYATVCKYFMNSLYGKLGQKQPIESAEYIDAPDTYIKHEIFNTITMEMTTETILLNRRIVKEGFKEGDKSMVAIPAHITEHGRMMLWELIKRVGPGKVLYSDTDSVKLESRYVPEYDDMIDDKALGMLKVEETFHEFEIHGPKDYRTENTTKLKGVPKTARVNDDGSYNYPTFLSQASHLRFQNMDEYMIRDTTKRNKRIYTKGAVNPDGYVVPIVVFDFE